MKWITDFTELPDTEVLAIGYQDECIVGYITNRSGEYECENDFEILPEVRGYIPISELVKSFNEQTDALSDRDRERLITGDWLPGQ